jgi:hypothetical protein
LEFTANFPTEKTDEKQKQMTNKNAEGNLLRVRTGVQPLAPTGEDAHVIASVSETETEGI